MALPDDVKSLRESVRGGKQLKYLAFWSHSPKQRDRVGAECLSQWFESSFEFAGVRYLTAEHWMMAEKARLFGDDEVLERILTATHPGQAKALGREVRGFEVGVWERERFGVVVRGNLLKFGENADLKAFLLRTGSRVLVEASPHDRIWGIGLAEQDPNWTDPEAWRGLNLLGFALMEVRRRLKNHLDG